MPSTVLAIAATDSSGTLKKIEIERREPQENDVDIEIKYCGICHSDLHQIRAEWPTPMHYPMVPGHEIAGVVRAVGKGVTKFKVGDHVGVGCIVDSCRECQNCSSNLEQFCPGMTGTYNSPAKWYKKPQPLTKVLPGLPTEITFGGYSQSVVVDESHVLKIPDSIDLSVAAPLLCAGITTYSPLSFFGAKDMGAKATTGVAGFGGLGHMAVKIAKAMGNTVVVFTTSPSKKAAIEALGAKCICTSNADDMKAATGKLCVVGAPPDSFNLHAFQIIFGRKTVCGSLIGGIKETQEMLDFCAANKISSDITLIHPKELNHAMVTLASNSGHANRFVIDIAKGLVPGDWEVEPDAKIDPSTWQPKGFITPPEARHPAHPK